MRHVRIKRGVQITPSFPKYLGRRNKMFPSWKVLFWRFCEHTADSNKMSFLFQPPGLIMDCWIQFIHRTLCHFWCDLEELRVCSWSNSILVRDSVNKHFRLSSDSVSIQGSSRFPNTVSDRLKSLRVRPVSNQVLRRDAVHCCAQSLLHFSTWIIVLRVARYHVGWQKEWLESHARATAPVV
jgi:hypothetical protein